MDLNVFVHKVKECNELQIQAGFVYTLIDMVMRHGPDDASKRLYVEA